jgi:RNA polymerase sigma-70 factor (ECF subfamily)
MTDAPEDGELVARLKAGDLDALGALYARYKTLVFRTALAITRDPEAAEDILQDCFLRVHAYAGTIDATLPLKPWLYRVTVNLSYTWATRHSRWRLPLEGLVDQLVSSSRFSPERLAEDGDQERAIHAAIERLGFSQRVVVVLHYLNDLSLKEIADILDCPVGTVKSRLHYARDNLRHYLTAGTGVPEVAYEYT